METCYFEENALELLICEDGAGYVAGKGVAKYKF
jgi:hypothetical protein